MQEPGHFAGLAQSMDHPVGDLAPPSLRGADGRRARASYRRVLPAALAISAVVHLIVLVVYPHFFPRKPPTNPVPFVLPVVTAGGGAIQLIHIVQVKEGAVGKPAHPVTPMAPPRPQIAPVTPNISGGAPGVTLVSPGAAAEALQPHLTDPRIWALVDSAATRLTLQERLQLALSGRIEEISDSMAAAEAAHRALTDWTFTDKNGKKWGIKDGKLVLDGHTVPIPFGFGAAEDAAMPNRDKWEWQEIQRGSAAQAVHDSWKDREKAMRERRDKERARERAKAQKDSTSGGG